MKLSSVLILLACCFVYTKQQKMVLCGRRLATARALVCSPSASMIKKDDKYTIEASMNEKVLEEELESWPWLGRQSALATRWGRHKRGLVEECCMKPCSVSEIKNYC